MNINGIHGSGALAGANAHDPKPARSHSSIPPAPEAAAAKTHISGPGQLFSGLSQLSQQDPTRFKEVAQQISEELSTAAQSSTGRASDLAQRLADRFGQAAETGDMSGFQGNGQRGGVGHHHHHHHLGGGSEEVRSVLESALDLVHEALNAPPGAPATDATATPATDATATPATDATATPPAAELSTPPATASPASNSEA